MAAGALAGCASVRRQPPPPNAALRTASDSSIAVQTNVPITSAAAQQGVAQGIPGAAPTPPAALLHPASYGASAENSAVAVGRNDFAATQIALAEPLPPPGVPTPLSLQAALETALAQNPDLVALRGGEPVSRAALGVARTYPINPWLQVQVLPFGQNIDGGATALNHYVLLMHTLELAHQGRFREQAGMADLNRVRWSILQAELLNVAQTQRLFFTALYQRGLRDLARATADVNAELASTLERQLDKGNASAAALAVAKLDRQSAERQARLADANYETALLDLRRQLNLPPNTAFEPQGDLTTWQWLPANAENLLAARSAGAPPARVPSRSEAVAQLASTRPDVMAARADVAMGSANVGLANAQRRPNLQIGPYYQRDDFGTVFVGFRSQFDIPVANNGRPLVRQREAELSQRRVVMGQAEQRARLEAEAAIDRYERARQLIEPVADNGSDVPDELQRLEKLYAENEIEVQQIVLARNSLLMARRSRLDSLNEAAQAAAAVTAATGLPPTALVVPRRP